MKMKIGKYNVTAKIKIVGLTDSAKEDFNKLLAKEEGKNDNRQDGEKRNDRQKGTGRNHHSNGTDNGIHRADFRWVHLNGEGDGMRLNKEDLMLMLATSIAIVVATEMLIWALTGDYLK